MNYAHVKTQKDFDKAAKIFPWSKWFMLILGLWPLASSNIIFFLNFGYFLYYMALDYIDFYFSLRSLALLVTNLTETMPFTTIISRLWTLHSHKKKLAFLISTSLEDFNISKYRSEEEKVTFMSYNGVAKFYVKLMIGEIMFTGILYYIKPLGMLSAALSPEDENATIVLPLPYRFYVFYPIQDLTTYILTYSSQIPFVIIITFGTAGGHCIMITLIYHLCGQMAILSSRIRDLEHEKNNISKELRILIKEHIKLLEMGRAIDESFSSAILVDLLCDTIGLCLLGFHIITILAAGSGVGLIIFGFFMSLTLFVMYILCSAGEQLVTESGKITEAIYNVKWRDLPRQDAYCILCCLLRSQKPLCLTSGGFGTFYLSTMTEVIKTSMGYLSILRKFMTP